VQPFACLQSEAGDEAFLPLRGFSVVDLGSQWSNAVSKTVNRFDEPAFTSTYLNLFDQIWDDKQRMDDVTGQVTGHIAPVDQENSLERIYFLNLYNIFREFLEDINTDVLPNDLTGFATLARSFFISMPVGDYNPDWAIEFEEATMRQV
jgi:SNF2 family DNA or RNA helicase